MSLKRRWQRTISIGFGIYSGLLLAACLTFLLINRSYALQIADQLLEPLLSIAIFSFLGVLLTYRRPENRISWLFIIVALMRQAGIVSTVTNILFAKGVEPTFWLLLAANLWYWWSALTYTILAYTIVLFPTGRLPSSRWRPASWLLGLQILLTAALIGFLTTDIFWAFRSAAAGQGTITLSPLVEGNSPFSLARHVRTIPEMTILGSPFALTALAMVLLGLLSQIGRYRWGDSLERQQIKWVGLALILWALALIPIIVPIGIPLNTLIIAASFIPIAIAVAILRYRLFDIDLIIRGTLVYGMLTALLLVIYFGTVTLLQSVVSLITGQSSPIIIVISTLIIAALFNPLRRRIQLAIDRRFYRRKYDAERILSSFAETARDEVNLDDLAAELLKVTRESLQPKSVSIWLSSAPSKSLDSKP